jgi:hypothetical protein
MNLLPGPCNAERPRQLALPGARSRPARTTVEGRLVIEISRIGGCPTALTRRSRLVADGAK